MKNSSASTTTGSRSKLSGELSTPGKKSKLMLTGNLLALSAAICWGFNEPANKMLIPGWLPASGVALARIFGATLMIWIISLFIKNEKIERSDWKLLIWGGVMMFGFVYVFSMAFITASPIDIAIILTFQPMLVVAINAIFKHQKVSVMEIVGMLIALGGAAIVIFAGGSMESGKLIGDLYALICAVTYAAYLVIIEGPSHRYGTISMMKWIFLFTSVICLPFLLFVNFHAPIFTHHNWIPIALLSFIILFPTVYCYIVTPPAIKDVGSDIFSIYQYFVPVIAAVVSILLKIDKFHWYQPVAFIVIVAGVMLANYAKSRYLKKESV